MSQPQYQLQPRWLSYEDAAKYSSLSTRSLERLITRKLISSKNIRMPGLDRGRRVIDRLSLDAYIEGSGDEASVCCQTRKKKGEPK